jgi:hypothetical protein
MNDSLITLLVNIAKCFAVGGLIGILMTIFTMILIRRLAKRARRYELNYVPITLVESKLWKTTLIAYPIFFGIAFAVICGMKIMH